MPADLVDDADVGMVQCRGRARFSAEPFQRVDVAHELVGQEFQSDVPSEVEILRLVHHAHPPSADFAEHRVMRDGLTDHESGRLQMSHARGPQRIRQSREGQSLQF